MASIGKLGKPCDQGRDDGAWNGAERYAAMQLNAAKKMRLAGLLDERAFHALCDLIKQGQAEVRYMPQLDSAAIFYRGAWRTVELFAAMVGEERSGEGTPPEQGR